MRGSLRSHQIFERRKVLNKLESFNRRLCSLFEWIALAGMLMMMFITCIDVVGAKLFKLPLLGALDFVVLSQLVAISFAAGLTLLKGRHVQVDFFIPLMPRFVQRVVNSITLLLVLGLFIIIIWRLGVLGYSFQESGEYSATAYIPMYPFAYALAFACIPICLIELQELLKTLTKGMLK
jgi:TRAP-type C4-dicarboxylate transport system permease small subunit